MIISILRMKSGTNPSAIPENTMVRTTASPTGMTLWATSSCSTNVSVPKTALQTNICTNYNAAASVLGSAVEPIGGASTYFREAVQWNEWCILQGIDPAPLLQQ